MNAIECQDESHGQARRLKLLIKLIERCSCPEEALNLAERMERFVLTGAVQESGSARQESTIQSAKAAIGTQCPTAQSTSGGTRSGSAQAWSSGVETNGDSGPILLCSPLDPRSGPTASGGTGDEAKACAPAVNPKTGKVYTKRRWTPQENEQLVKLAAEEHTVDQIARALDRTPIGIRERARAKGIKIKPRKRGRQPSKRMIETPCHLSTAAGSANGQPSRHGDRVGKFAVKRAKAGKKRRASDPKKDADMVRAFLLEHGATRPTLSMETVVKFMRTRDYSVVMGEDGRYVVDGRDRMTATELVKRANVLRIDLGQSTFPEDLGALEGDERANGNGSSYLPIASAIQVPAPVPN